MSSAQYTPLSETAADSSVSVASAFGCLFLPPCSGSTLDNDDDNSKPNTDYDERL